MNLNRTKPRFSKQILLVPWALRHIEVPLYIAILWKKSDTNTVIPAVSDNPKINWSVRTAQNTSGNKNSTYGEIFAVLHTLPYLSGSIWTDYENLQATKHYKKYVPPPLRPLLSLLKRSCVANNATPVTFQRLDQASGFSLDNFS